MSIFANRRKNNTFMTDTYGLINPIYYSRIANPTLLRLTNKETTFTITT